MRRIASLLLALISLAWSAPAATRPHYGGTLRVEMQSAPVTLDLPGSTTVSDYWDMVRVLSLVGDTLVSIDAEGRPEPALALSWQSDSTASHWQFTLHHRAKFHDGSLASPGAIAQILGPLHPDWNVRAGSATADALTIDTETPAPSLLAELALPRNLILTRTAAGTMVGTGSFRIVEFQPGKLLKLGANEDSWSGRPFVDALEIEFGKSLRDQSVALELGRTDVIEASPQSANASARVPTSSSLPIELMALVFPPNSKARDAHLRRALALCYRSEANPVRSPQRCR